MRLRGAKNTLEEMGEDTEGMYETTAKLRKEVLGIAGVDIMKDENTFKSTYQILDELSQKWSQISDLQKSALVESLAGKRGGNMFNALMNNFDIARDAMKQAETAGGYSEEALGRYQEGIQYHIDAFKASFQELSQDLISSDLIKGFVDLGTTGVKAIDSITKATSGLGLVLGGFLGSQIFKKLTGNQNNYIDIFTNMARAAMQATPALNQVTGAITETNEALAVMQAAQVGVGTASGGGLLGLLASPVGAIAGVVAMIGAAAFAIQKYQHDVIEARERIDEAMEKSQSNISQAKQEFESVNSSIDNVKQRYAELSDGVSTAGNQIKNISLTPDEYSEFLSLNKEIANVAPDLVKGYDAQGNALLNLGSGYESVTESLESYIEKLRELQNQTIAENYQDLYNGTVANVRDLEMAGGNGEDINKILKRRSVSGAGVDTYEKMLRAANLNFRKTLVDADSNTWEFIVSNSEAEIRSAMNTLTNYAGNKIDEYWSETADALRSTLSLTDAFKGMSDEASDAFDTIFSNLDWSEISKIDGTAADGMQSWVMENVIAPLNDSDGLVNDAMENLFELFKAGEAGEISGTEFMTRLNSVLSSSQITGLDVNVQNAIREAFTFKSQTGATINEMVNNIATRFSKATGKILIPGLFGGLSIDNLTRVFEGDINIDDDIENITQAIEDYKASLEDTDNIAINNADLSESFDAVADAAESAGMTAREWLESYSTASPIQQQIMLAQAIQATIEKEKELREYGFDINDRSGLEQYNATKDTKSHRADYDEYKAIAEATQKLYEAGQVGDEVFKNGAKLFSEAGFTDAENWIQNWGNLKGYFADGKKKKKKFLEDASKLTDKDNNPFAQLGADGETWELNLRYMEEFANKMNMPIEMLTVFLEALQSFGFTDDYFGNLETGTQHLTDLYKQQAQEYQKLHEMESAADGTWTDEQIQHQEEVAKSFDERIDRMKQSLGEFREDAENAQQLVEDNASATTQTMQSLIDQYNEGVANGDSEDSLNALKQAIDDYSDEVHIPVVFDPETNEASIDRSIEEDEERIQKYSK